MIIILSRIPTVHGPEDGELNGAKDDFLFLVDFGLLIAFINM